MQIYKTPFSRAYWRDAAADFRKLRNLMFSALMVAACVALSYLQSVPLPLGGKITWGFLARSLCALVCGPVNAILFGVVEDTVSYFMNPSGGYNPAYILTTVLGVLTYALFLYRARVTVTRIALAKLVTNIENIFLESLWDCLWYSSKGYWVLVGGRAIKNIALWPAQTLILVILFSALMPILCRAGLLPRESLHPSLRQAVDRLDARTKGLRGKKHETAGPKTEKAKEHEERQETKEP